MHCLTIIEAGATDIGTNTSRDGDCAPDMVAFTAEGASTAIEAAPAAASAAAAATTATSAAGSVFSVFSQKRRSRKTVLAGGDNRVS